ncbi:MAG: hypothetical protein BHW26_03615 [Faecalibacterium prausnitzii]|nr:MAG: hypothetical protein BHW26_03615 [Faecalibacterium prausnitzii]
MPKDDERKEMTQEEIDAREEKFRTFFTTSVAQVPEEMTRRDDENEEKPKSLLGRLLRREKGEQQESGTPEESRTGEIQLGGEEPEEPSDLELVLTLEEEVTERPSSRSLPSRSAPPSLRRKSPKSPQNPSKRRSRLLPSRRKSRQKSRLHPGKRRSSTSRAPRRSSTRTGRCRRSKPCCLVQSFRRRRKSLPSR